MIHEDNAAGRLWTIFNEVRSGIGYFGPKDAWSSALKLEKPSEIEYHTAMIGAYGLLLEVHDELQSLNGLFDLTLTATHHTLSIGDKPSACHPTRRDTKLKTLSLKPPWTC